MMAINVYFIMAVASIIGIVRRHHVSFLVAKAAAPIGAGLTLAAIVTGALWGQPTWGTWWEWDPKLTSILIMLFFYLGYIGLWEAVEDPDKAGDLSGVLCLVGVVFAVMSRYAVEIFGDQTLHQPASLSLDAETNVSNVFYKPLLVTIVGFYLFFIAHGAAARAHRDPAAPGAGAAHGARRRGGRVMGFLAEGANWGYVTAAYRDGGDHGRAGLGERGAGRRARRDLEELESQKGPRRRRAS
jgi:heme exporter protein CcmC